MRILLLAYSCEPGRGSEPESGWNWATRLAEEHDVYVISHPHNQSGVARANVSDINPRLHITFTGTGLPRRLDVWARDTQPEGLELMINYMFWQLSSYAVARRMLRQTRFDIVHHVTWGTVEGLTLGWALGPPFILGPVGGAQVAPWRMRRYFGMAWPREMVRSARVKNLYLNPWARVAARKAKVVFAANRETTTALKNLGARDVRLMPTAAVMPEWAPSQLPPRRENSTPIVVWVGRFEPRKAPALAIEAVARAMPESRMKLVMIGDGELLPECRQLAARLGIAGDVHFTGQISRQDVARYLALADIFIFTSLRDTFAAAPLEAMAYGLPVVALNHQAVVLLPDQAVLKVEVTEPDAVVASLAGSLVRLLRSEELRRSMGEAGWATVQQSHLWTHRVDGARVAYEELVGAHPQPMTSLRCETNPHPRVAPDHSRDGQ
jgi:glycosyltransferase involved in cell wall biosynthesis